MIERIGFEKILQVNSMNRGKVTVEKFSTGQTVIVSGKDYKVTGVLEEFDESDNEIIVNVDGFYACIGIDIDSITAIKLKEEED